MTVDQLTKKSIPNGIPHKKVLQGVLYFNGQLPTLANAISFGGEQTGLTDSTFVVERLVFAERLPTLETIVSSG